MAKKDIQNQIDSELNNLNGEVDTDAEASNLGNKMSKPFNNASNKIGNSINNKIGNSIENKLSGNKDKSDKKNNKSKNLNRFKNSSNNAIQRTRQRLKDIKRTAKATMKMIQLIIRLVLAIFTNPIFWILMLIVVLIAVVLSIFSWFNFNIDNINGSFYSSTATNEIKYDAHTNEVVESKLSVSNVLGGVFFEYYARNSYYYTVTPPTNNDGKVLSSGQRALKDNEYNTVKQHTSKDTNDSDFKIIDKFGTESKFTLNSIMLMTLNKHLNQKLEQTYYYPEQFIQPLYNSCTIADNDKLYNEFVNLYNSDNNVIPYDDYLKVNKRRSAKDKNWNDLSNNGFDDIKCERINIFNSDKKTVSALSAKYKEIFLTASNKEITADEYNKKKNKGELVYKAFKTTDNEYEYGTWSWGLAPIFNYKEYNEYDEIRNIRISTVPVWNKEEQRFDNITYENLTDEQKKEIKPKLKENWSNITQNENSVYLIDKVISYMGNADNGTELQENLTMSNYSAFKNSQQKENFKIEKLVKSNEISLDELTKKKITEIVYKDKSYKNVTIKLEYKEEDRKTCEKEKEMCNAGLLDKKYDANICSIYTKCSDKYNPDGSYCDSAKYDKVNTQKCLAKLNSKQLITMIESDGTETILAEDISKLGETKIYYEETIEGVLQYVGDLFEFRANYATDFAKVSNVSFDYIYSYINNYVLVTPFENHDDDDGKRFCTNIENVDVTIDDYVKFYSGDSVVSPKSSTIENNKKVQEKIKELKEKNTSGKITINLVDPYIRVGGSYNCKNNPLKCILADTEVTQLQELENLGAYTSRNVCTPNDTHCQEYQSQKPMLCVKVPVVTKETKNMTELSADTRSYSQYLQIADLFGMNVGSDMDAASSNNGSFNGTLIDGDLCVHATRRGKEKTYMAFNKLFGNAPVTAYVYKGLNLTTEADLRKYYLEDHHYNSKGSGFNFYVKTINDVIKNYPDINPPKLIIDNQGFILTEDGFYAVALGSFYGDVGDRFIFTTEYGEEIKVVKTDEKSDNDTDANHCYHDIQDDDKSTIEFVMDLTVPAATHSPVKLRPSLEGKLVSVKKVISDGENSNNNSGNSNNNTNTETPNNEKLSSSIGIAIGTNSQRSEILKIINDSSFDEIKTVANTYGVDPNLIASIAASASGGKHTIDNCKNGGICGFMGININKYKTDNKLKLTTYNFDENKDETVEFSYDDLKDKSKNIKAGIMILAKNLKTYRYNPLLALYAYNRGNVEIDDAIDEYTKKAKINKENVYNNYSDISWRAYAKQEGYNFIESVLNYFPATYLNFKTIDNSDIGNKSITLESLSNIQNNTTSSSNENTLAGRLQNKIDTLMSGKLIDENWDGLYPDKQKETTEHDYSNIDGEIIDGVEYYQKHIASESNSIDIDAIIKNAYIIGTNSSIEDYDNITQQDWEQKFLESFGKRSTGNYITTDIFDYFPESAFALLSSEQLSLYQPYGVNKDTDTGKKQNHTYIGIKTSTGAKISNVNKGEILSIAQKDGGYQISIKHGEMSISEFKNLKTISTDLKVGQKIDAGVIIGITGEEAFKYALKVDGKYVNPEWMLRYGQSGAFITDTGNYTIVGDSVLGNLIAQKALTKLNLPYLWGGCHNSSCINNPNATTFDCSGLVTWALTQSGVNTNGPKDTKALVRMGGAVADISQAQAGDVILYSKTTNPADVHHAGIYLGNGMMVHTPTTGRVSQVAKVWTHEKVFIRRIY